MLLDNLNIILLKTRFPENIGMAARACANMGCPSLSLITPQRWNLDRSRPLATNKGERILNNLTIFPSLTDALADSHQIFATSARIGGWHKNVIYLHQAAGKISEALKKSLKVSIVFGPEDTGLLNEELKIFPDIIHIPTFGASSLNLGQAVLLVLYECAKQMANPDIQQSVEKRIPHSEMVCLENELFNILLRLNCLAGRNPDYHFMLWRRLLDKVHVEKHEYAALMGLFRKLNNFLNKGEKHGQNETE